MTDLRVYRDGSEIFAWEWEAHYTDGTILLQNENGLTHKFREINQSILAAFILKSIDPDVKPVIIMFKPGRKLIYFTRVHFLNTGSEKELLMRTYHLGYEEQRGPNIENAKVILTIMPDNGIIVSDSANINMNVIEV